MINVAMLKVVVTLCSCAAVVSQLINPISPSRCLLTLATLQSVQSGASSGISVMAFTLNHASQSDVKDYLLKAAEDWCETVTFSLAQPDNANFSQLQALFNVTRFPSIIVYSVKGKRIDTKLRLQQYDCTSQQLEIGLIAQSIPTSHLQEANFADEVLVPMQDYTPHLIVFYAYWNPLVIQYLKAFWRTIADFRDLDVRLKFGLVDLQTSRNLLMRHLPAINPVKYPIMVYFFADMERHKVIGVRYELMDIDLPTPLSTFNYLVGRGIHVLSSSGLAVTYQPWGSSVGQECLMSEGPLGYMCSISTHNLTDAEPKLWPNYLIKERPEQPAYNEQIFTLSHKLPFDLLNLKKQLRTVDGLPYLTSSTWSSLIERSRHSHPFGRIQEEAASVALVIFIRANCGNCQRNMDNFRLIRNHTEKGLVHGSVFLVNCSEEVALCDRHSVTGFPTLVAFRSLDWLHYKNCLSEGSAIKLKFVREDYHGSLVVSLVMDWLYKVSKPAVNYIKYDAVQVKDSMTDAYLVGSLFPKMSHFLPKRKGSSPGSRLPYECFRLVCEQLFAQVSCFARHPDVRTLEESVGLDLYDMVITEVTLNRKDGLKTRVMQADRRFSRLMGEESTSSIHKLHVPHRYTVSAEQTCEHNHSHCVDHMVQYTLDHARLAITTLDSRAFHTHNGLVGDRNLPVLIAFAHSSNLSHESSFYQALELAARQLYNVARVAVVDILHYHFWANQFVPKNYNIDMKLQGKEPSLYIYPRMCIINWTNHERAAFYPDIDVPVSLRVPFNFTALGIIRFAESYLQNPAKYLIETEIY